MDTMDAEDRVKRTLWVLFVTLLLLLVLMTAGVCTTSWYCTHPLAPELHTSFGYFGLLKHCGKNTELCMVRKEVLKFADRYWPYRPLRSKDFDVTLLLLILAMMCTVTALLLVTWFFCSPFYTHNVRLKWMLLFSSIMSAILTTCGVLYLDTKVKSEQFRHSGTSYVMWLTVGFSTLVNIPSVYLLSVKPTDQPANRRCMEEMDNKVVPPDRTHCGLQNGSKYEYPDIHGVE